MSGNDDFWWCADETGELHTLTGDELRGCLADRSIPAHALVWRKGWASWAPAARVPSFHKVLARKDVELAALPARVAVQSEPPPPPLDYYAERRAKKRAGLAPLELDLSDISSAPESEPGFPAEEVPTKQVRIGTLPEEAFPEREAFLAHIRARRGRESLPTIPEE